jgi:hypothetical protein
VTVRNASLGAAEVEVIRRLNEAVVPVLNQAQHRFVVEHGLRPTLSVDSPRPLRLPAEDLPWAREYAEGLVAELRRRGVHVVGGLTELVPIGHAEAARRIDDVTGSELLEATQAALAALAIGHGRLFRRYRRAFVEREGRPATALEVVGSSSRRFAFGLKKTALRRTRDSRLLARAARAYLSRTSGRRWPGED